MTDDPPRVIARLRSVARSSETRSVDNRRFSVEMADADLHVFRAARQRANGFGAMATTATRSRAVAQAMAGEGIWKRPSLPSFDAIRRITQGLTEAAASMARQTELFASTAPLMLELDWPPMLEASLSEMNELLVIYQARGRDAAHSYVEALARDCYDDETLRSRLICWAGEPILARRMRFVRAGVEAHLRGDYACSVPTLLPQIEGIIVDCYQGVPGLESKRVEVLAGRLLCSTDEAGVVLARVDALMREYYLRQVLQRIGRLDEVPDRLNRHCVLHGRDLAYDTQANSLRTIILLEYLSTSLVILSAAGSRVYHRGGCSAVLRSRAALEVLTDPRAARALGKRPCRICNPPEWSVA